MLRRLFPERLDNHYRGHWLAIWLLVPIVIVRLMIGVNSMLNTRFVATTADGIPLDRYDPAGAQAVISLFALLGLFQFLLGLQGVLVLLRYRAAIPLMYLLLLFQQFGARALNTLHPSGPPGGASPGSILVLALLAIGLAGFVLSLLTKPDRAS